MSKYRFHCFDIQIWFHAIKLFMKLVCIVRLVWFCLIRLNYSLNHQNIIRIWLVLSHAIICVIILSFIKKYNLLARWILTAWWLPGNHNILVQKIKNHSLSLRTQNVLFFMTCYFFVNCTRNCTHEKKSF